MKKLIIALIVAGLLVLSMAVPVFADIRTNAGVDGSAVAADASDATPGTINQPTTGNPHNACVDTCSHPGLHRH